MDLILSTLLALGFVPMIMLVGFSPTWIASVVYAYTKLKNNETSNVKVLAVSSYLSAIFTFILLMLHAMAKSGI
jgi:hypothetical protein